LLFLVSFCCTLHATYIVNGFGLWYGDRMGSKRLPFTMKLTFLSRGVNWKTYLLAMMESFVKFCCCFLPIRQTCKLRIFHSLLCRFFLVWDWYRFSWDWAWKLYKSVIR
jgi:hypothetical protein